METRPGRFMVMTGGMGFLLVGVVLHFWAGSAEAAPQTCRKGFFPASGQTTCWDSLGHEIPCFGTDQDGDIQAGAPLRFQDNGDGTITDLNTGLVWEKHSDDGTVHDMNNTYTWENAFLLHIAELNATSFAGYQDWRLANVKELVSKIDFGQEGLSDPPVGVHSAFHNNCSPGCTVLTCSCTASSSFWSSTSAPQQPTVALIVGGVLVSAVLKSDTNQKWQVRAVRGGCVD